MKVELHYGKGIVSLQVPRGNIEQIITPWQDEAGGDNSALLHEALASRAAVDFRNQIAGKRLCVLAEDGTRDVPLGDICDCLFDRLKGASAVQFLIATGTHKAETAENEKIRQTIEQAAGNAGIADFEMHAHDCRQGAFVEAGRTAHGTPVSFNAHAKDADVFLVLSDVKTHYFAGYSNPVKNFVPGICVFETAEQNHSLALEDNSTFGTHPWRRDESRRNNPVAADQVEAMQMIVGDRPVYAFVTISTCRKVQWAGFGPVEQVAAEAFEKIDERNTHAVKPVSKLIVSPGGFPNDISLYIAQRALELTKNAVTDGGEILFLAACPDGVGEEGTMENFYNRLTAPLDQILESIEAEYKLYAHKPYKFAQLIWRLSKIRMHTEIGDDIIEAAHLHATGDPQAVVDGWLAEDPAVRITIVDGANKIALYAKAEGG
jgi:nickel-dependent lactate racemase